METLQIPFKAQSLQSSNSKLMNSTILFSRFKPNFFFLSKLNSFSTSTIGTNPLTPLLALKTDTAAAAVVTTTSRNAARVVKLKEAEAARQLKENWLHSLSSPFPLVNHTQEELCTPQSNVGSNWVIGIDPDISGAISVLKFDDSDCSAQVFDSPHLKVLVGKRVRKRLDAKSIVQLLHGFNAQTGTIAYIEQSVPYPQDGKQGWWSGGFGYGLWIGILVASGFNVVPVSSQSWKNEYELSGSKTTKDDSRRVASTLFPLLSSSLTRKKDHGRAEALLIAAYGKGLKLKSELPCSLGELP